MTINESDSVIRARSVEGTVGETGASVPILGPWQAVNGTKCEQPDHQSGRRCKTCLKALPAGSRRFYCSTTCRLRAWALRELMKALHDGTVDGLQAGLRELARKMGVRLD